MPSEEGEPADATLVGRLRAGDSDAFAEVVRAWSPMMLQAARGYVSTDASAQEVVQDAWLAMIRGLDKFEGRSSLRT
jgi:RNA polymerase sigma-70 factor (ECF subfamily)